MKRTVFDLPLTLVRGANAPLRLQLLRELRSAIQRGRLVPGNALPSTRVLAQDLGVSRGLVVEAYEQLIAEGYLLARQGSATRVAERVVDGRRTAETRTAISAEEAREWRYDFRPGIPDTSMFPTRAWLRSLRRAWTESRADLDYPDPHGPRPVRSALASYLNRSRATVADAERIVLCTGFAQAVRLIGEALRARGVRRLAVENPGHILQCADLGATGIELVPVPVDDGGLCVHRLAEVDVRAALVTPAHQYPTGAVLEPERRVALLEWAERCDGFVLEDDYDAEYRYDREPVGALQGLAPERVLYIGSASKTLAPALRQGWIVIPSELVGELRRAKLAADRGSPVLEQMALASFLESGDLDRHLRRTRTVYRRRRDVLVGALDAELPEVRKRGVAAGLHLLITLSSGTHEQRVVSEAERRGVRIYGAGAYHLLPYDGSPALLLGYGGIAESEIVGGVAALAEAIRASGARPA